jgi:hypothetical protein
MEHLLTHTVMHADDGFCAAIRKAKLVVLVQDRFGNIVQIIT